MFCNFLICAIDLQEAGDDEHLIADDSKDGAEEEG